jgi:hypothetical protein
VEPKRPDAIDDLISDVIGLARPAVDAAIDKAALIALDAVRGLADELRNVPHYPSLPNEGMATDAIFVQGWDDGLSALILAIDGVRRRLSNGVAAGDQ